MSRARWAAAPLLAVFFIAAASCSGPSIVGKWESLDSALALTTEFLPDGTCVYKVGLLQQSETYRVEGDKVFMSSTNFISGKKEGEVQGTWKVEGDTLTLTLGGTTSRYRRVKG